MKVVIGFDGSPSARHAVQRAVELFGPADPRIVLLGVVSPPTSTSPVTETAHAELCAEFRAEMREVIDELREPSLSIEATLMEGDPRRGLAKYVSAEKPDVVVVGARGQNRIAKMLLGSVSTYAVKYLPVPVIVVRLPEEIET